MGWILEQDAVDILDAQQPRACDKPFSCSISRRSASRSSLGGSIGPCVGPVAVHVHARNGPEGKTMAKAAANIPAPALGPQTSHSDYISRPNTSHSPGPHFAVKLTQRIGSDSDPRREDS